MAYQEDIIDILDKALVEKTFDLEIITKIKALKDEHILALQRIKDLEGERQVMIDARSKTDSNVQMLTKELEEWRAKSQAISESEKKADRMAYELQFQKDRGNEIKEMFMHVFRNPSIVRSKVTSVPVYQNGYFSNQQGSESETEKII